MQAIQTVELHPSQIERLNNQPEIKTKMYWSEDGLWFIHETRIIDIKHKNYMNKVGEKDEAY